MRTVNIYKAQPLCTTAPEVESVAIFIDRAVPDLPENPTPPFMNVLDEARAIYAKEAEEIAEALFTSLPGGTLDALLVEMMRRKVSLFRVAYTTKEG